ncbi:MAG: hypothetical protein RI958_2592 [Actinomycetota bacterium]
MRRPAEGMSIDRPQPPSTSLRSVADVMPQVVWMASADGLVEYFNGRVGAFDGSVRAEDGHWAWSPRFHPDDAAPTLSLWRHAVATGEPFVCEHRVRMSDGTFRWYLSHAELVDDSSTGAPRWFGYATDVHEHKVTEQRLNDALGRLRHLQAVTATLAAPLWDEQSVVEALLRDGVHAAGGEEAAVVVHDRRGRPRLFGGTDEDSELIESAMSEHAIVVRRIAADAGRSGGRAAATGPSVHAAAAFPAALGIVGGVAVRYADRSELSGYEHAALRSVAELGAQALLRSRAYQDEQRRADQAEALQDLASALAESTTVIAVADAIATFAGRSAGAEFAIVAVPVTGSDRLRLVHARSLGADVDETWSAVGLDERTPLSDAFRTGAPVFVPDHSARLRSYPHLVEATTATPIVASATLPMATQDGRVVGALGFGWFDEQIFADDDVALLETVVSLSGQAMQRAAFFEAEQERQVYTDLARNAGVGIAACLTVDEVARFIVHKGASALGATTATVFGTKQPVAEVLATTVPGAPPRLEHLADVRWLRDAVVADGSLLIPVVVSGAERPVAVVHMDVAHSTHWAAHRHRLAAVANEWGQALERAVAHDAEQAAFRRTEQLQHVTASLAQAPRSVDVTHVVESQLPRAFGVRSASIVRMGQYGQPALDETLVALDDTDPAGESLVLRSDRQLTAAERAAAEAFAAQCARALARTRLAEREHEIATELQHALLGEVDLVEGLALGTVYLASEDGLDIGGDWYDVIRRKDDTAVLVVGDVVGHSLSAATAMGQLRSAVRALAHLCDSPDVLLDHVAGYAENVRDARYSTLVLVYLDMHSGSFRYACAGHPPPLVVSADGTTVFVEGARNPPLGAFAAGSVQAAESSIPPGGSLVLYTDGLVEHRGASIDDGFDEIARLAGRAASLPPELLATRLVSEVFARTAPRDDVAVLAVSLPPSDSISWRFAADTAHLAPIRQDMRGFLRGHDLPPDRIDDMLLLAGEALANSVEHAYHDRAAGPVSARLEHRGGELRLVVVDEGGWRVPQAPGQRGRGVGIIRALADELVIEQRSNGTTVFARLGGPVQ